MSKQYGLIDPKANKSKLGVTKHAAFASDSDSDSCPTKKPSVNLCLGESQKRQARAAQQKALEEDPTIYQYDELYDDMDQKRKEAKAGKSQEERKPKYITKLLETADKRKKEQERRIERQIQKEREAEGEMYKDKESFVTSAYRAKLEEMKKAEEEEKREEYLERIGDVTKQGDLGGFYRHIYSQKMGEKSNEETPKDETIDIKQEQPDSEDEEQPSDNNAPCNKESSAKVRRYRKRASDDNDEHEGDEKNDSNKKIHLQSNLDADSDFSIDSNSSSNEMSESEEDEKSDKKDKNAVKILPKSPPEALKLDQATDLSSTIVPREEKKPPKEDLNGKEMVKSEEEVQVIKAPKIDIWKKRTVGDLFDAALQRYFERKAARETG
ncbi:nuclear speckle splicing regulatory protein 1 [Uranotaenia lowii]|uniref:nuclear speckle splicing regulatory protein 1 n=1 Tax=Uranotaenia lowii TaxID=190385 RepID=UPI002479716C|nr:nuclear speckle splicing regulatory protein 1 [Uranotaenia lowii]